MANTKLDASQEGDSYRRVEVITGERRRRRWTGEEKARIVAESFEEVRTSPRWRGAMPSPACCSWCGAARLRRRWPARRRSSCRSKSAPEAVADSRRVRAYFVGTNDVFGNRRAAGQALRGDRNRGDWSAHSGRARLGVGDAFDGAVGAPGYPVIALRSDLKVVLAIQPVDFRKSVHTLRANPYRGDVFVFRQQAHGQSEASGVGRQRQGAGDEVLHQGRFTWPPVRDGMIHLSATQLAMLLDWLEWTRVSPKPVKQPALVG